MAKIPRVAVIIPAYNEAANIRHLLHHLVEQSQDGFSLDTIVVYSDGSNDTTVSEAQSVQDPRITVIDAKDRVGLAGALHVLFQHVDSDVAVLLNADIRFADAHIISRLVAPIITGEADLSAALIEELPAQNFFARVLTVGMQWKKEAFYVWQNGHNLFTCFGPARAFSKRLYQDIYFPFSAADDAYSYLFCQSQGFTFRFVPQARVYYRLPSHVIDHMRQSFRFFHAMKEIEYIFGEEVVKAATTLPVTLLLKMAGKHFVKHPFLLTSYGCLLVLLRIAQPFLKSPDLQRWGMVKTSKTSLHI